MDMDVFLETVRRYTGATKLTRRMVAELIEHIDVYHAEKQDGITTQKIVIHYNCIGPFWCRTAKTSRSWTSSWKQERE